MYLWLLALLKELLFSLLLITLLPCEVLVSRYLIDLLLVNAGQVHLVGCGDDITGIDSPERNTIDFEWAGNEENALWESLQKNDSLAAETTSKKNEDGSGSKRWSGS